MSFLFFLNSFLVLNLLQKQPQEFFCKKHSLKFLEYAQENVLKSLFNNIAGLQGCCKTLYSPLRFYFSLGKKFHQLSMNYIKVIFTVAYFERS